MIGSINKEIKIILGGIHASVMYHQLLENLDINAVVIGEAEETIKELVPRLLKNKNLGKIKGISFKRGKRIIKTPDRELIHNLDALPFPSHEAFMNDKRTNICMLSSRGCPSNCSFCCLHLISRRRYRIRSYINVADEVEYIAKKFPKIKTIEFSDDTFTLVERRVIDFCKELIKREIKMKLICSARIKPFSIEMLDWMEKAGFIEVRFGVESGSREILESIHKSITPEEIIKTFKIASHAKKIKFIKFLMVGFPGENEKTIKETIELSKKLNKILPMDFFYATPLWVYPGTEVYEIMKSKKMIDDSYWMSDKPCPYYTVEYTKEELFQMSNRIALETIIDRGYIYLTKLVLKKIITRPRYYLKRALNSKLLIPHIFKKLRRFFIHKHDKIQD